MRYYFKPSALKDLKKLPKQIQKRIIAKLDFYTNTQNPLKFAESIQDESLGQFRFRIGDYRTVFDMDGDEIIILKIGHRRDIYR